MDRIDRLLEHPIFRDCIDRIEEAEKNRSFCRHGLEHCLDVARISYIMAMEEQLHIDREVIYAAALLHDLGRCMEYEQNIPHHQAGVGVAEQILPDVGYTAEEQEDICRAISCHKVPAPEDDRGDLCYLLYRADKLSRNCFVCKAREACYWNEDVKNRSIVR
ncbi:MAG: HD domain-containing protein [Wujia sp.]